MAGFGEELRREREQRGVAVEAICQVTKVSAKHIRALEAGELQDLPGGVFRRGFVRSYLGALGLEQEAWMRRFEETCQENGVSQAGATEWMAFAENVKNSRTPTHRPLGLRWVGAGVLLASAALAGWCGWRLAKHRRLLPAPLVWTDLNSWVDNAPSR
ncbi:MAG: helix-turn-helix domain-containing protein [Acidobacteriaceae bacterium]